MQAVGSRLYHRAPSLEEMLHVFRAVWRPGPVNYDGKAEDIKDSYMLPKPVGALPVYIGGGYAPASVKHIAENADGWIADGGLRPDVVAAIWSSMQKRAVGVNRNVGAMQLLVQANISVTQKPVEGERRVLSGSLDQIVEDFADYARVGVNEIILNAQLDESMPGVEAMWETAREIFNEVSNM